MGKSSLFRRFAQNTFVASSDRASTLGLDHYDKVYKVIGREIKVAFNFRVSKAVEFRRKLNIDAIAASFIPLSD